MNFINILSENLVLGGNHYNQIIFKPFFQDINYYTYIHNNYEISNKYKYLFMQFKRHPLIFWKLEINLDNNVYLFDFITNLSNNKFNYNVYNINEVNYVCDPCMLYNSDEFLLNFNKNNIKGYSFSKANLYIDIYKSTLISKLNHEIFNHGIFYQKSTDKIYINILQSKIKNKLLNEK